MYHLLLAQVLETLKGPYSRCDSNLLLNDYQAMHSIVLTLVGLKVTTVLSVSILGAIPLIVGCY